MIRVLSELKKSIILITDRERHHDIHLLLRKVGREQRSFFARLRAWALNQRSIYFSDPVEFTKYGNTLFRPVYGRLTISSSFMSVQTKIRS